MTASQFCPTRYSSEKSHLAQPYKIVDSTSFCETKPGHFYLPGNGYGSCDADGDGWVTLEGYRATNYSADTITINTKVKANARCTIRKITALRYFRDYYKDKEFLQNLPAETPLLETARNDGQGELMLAPVYTTNNAPLPTTTGISCDSKTACSGGKVCYKGHCVTGKRIPAKLINTLTKACIAGLDLNDNGLLDVLEAPSLNASPKDFQNLLLASYHVELFHGYYEKITRSGKQISVYTLIERPRAKATKDGGVPVSCQNTPTGANSPGYWKWCNLRDDQQCKGGKGHAAKGLTDCWMENVQQALPSLLKCVTFNSIDSKDYFYAGNYGITKKYTRTLCSLNGSVNFKYSSSSPQTTSMQFTCSADNGKRTPQGAQVGWACVNHQAYTNTHRLCSRLHR